MEYQTLICSSEGMRRFPFFLIMMVVMITGFMVHLYKSGISLRPATLIKPSEIHSPGQVAQAVVVRLFPEFQSKKWLIYNPKPSTEFTKIFFLVLLREVKTTPAGEYRVSEDGKSCDKHCIFVDETESTHSFYQERFAPLMENETEPTFRIQMIEFTGTEVFPPECESMQRLDEKCIHAVSIRSALPKMKDPAKKYFFLKKYNHNQYYLFVSR